MIDSEVIGLENSRRKKEHALLDRFYLFFLPGAPYWLVTILSLLLSARANLIVFFCQFAACLTETDSGIPSACGKGKGSRQVETMRRIFQTAPFNRRTLPWSIDIRES